jgi:hypothetical protein
MQQRLSERDLQSELEDLRSRFGKLKDHELFVLWFLRAMVTDDEISAAKALTGNSGDKGCDAVLIDDHAKVAFLIQGKYRHKLGKSNEPRSDVVSFARLANDLFGTEDDFKSLAKDLDPGVHQKLSYARECIKKRKYRLMLYYATLSKCSKALAHEAARICRAADGVAEIDIVDARRILLRLADYLDGVAPPVPSLDLAMEVGHGIISGSHSRFDSRSNITSWVFSMNASAVAEMYAQTGIRLFARNVRGFLGKTEINEGMDETLTSEPWNFWYYNNGITMICDQAERISAGGRDVMRVSNPQVINGQQTTRTLHAYHPKNSPAAVQIRVIEVRRDPKSDGDQFEGLVSRIVAATNWQNEIRASDLMSNDRRQIELERNLRKYGYDYLRKRQSKVEARRTLGVQHRTVTKEEIAQAVAACDLDPAVVRKGKEGLFEEHFYLQIFPTSEAQYYLSRYRLMREVGYQSRGYPERAYAKWLVLHHLWSHLEPIVRSRAGATAFREACERNDSPMWPLSQAILSVYRGALAFYRKTKGKGEKAVDVSTFFKRTKLSPEFDRFLRGSGLSFHRIFKKRWKQFEKQVKSTNNAQ